MGQNIKSRLRSKKKKIISIHYIIFKPFLKSYYSSGLKSLKPGPDCSKSRDKSLYLYIYIRIPKPAIVFIYGSKNIKTLGRCQNIVPKLVLLIKQ